MQSFTRIALLAIACVVAIIVCCGFALPSFAADPPKTDSDGYPLSKGAIMRLGTLRNRAPISSFGIEKDGTVITIEDGPEVRRWGAKEDKSSEAIKLAPLVSDTLDDSAQVSPDGKYIAGRSNEKVFVWATPTDPKAKLKQIAAFEITAVAGFHFSPDGSKLIVMTDKQRNANDDSPRLNYFCDIKSGKMLEGEGLATSTRQMTISGDGKRAIELMIDHFILWEIETGKKLADCRIEADLIFCALNHSGDLLVMQSMRSGKNESLFFDTLTGKKHDNLTGPKDGDWATFAPDGKTLLVGSRSGVELWDPVAKKRLRRFEGDGQGEARFSPDGKTLVGTNGIVLYRWNAETGQPLFESQASGHARGVTAVGISPDGKRIATRASDHRLCVWDASTGKKLWQTSAYESYSPRVDFSPDGKFLYVPGEKRDEVTKRDAATGKILQKYTPDPKQLKETRVFSIRVSPDGKAITALLGPAEPLFSNPDDSKLSRVVTWNSESGEQLKTSEVSDLAVYLDLSPDATYLAVTGTGTAVRLVGDQVANLIQGANFRSDSACEFSADGKWLTVIVITEGANKQPVRNATVISTKTWQVVGSILMRQNDGYAALSPDGSTLVMAHDGRLEFYDVAKEKLIDGYDISSGDWKQRHIQVLRFTPDGTKVITGHAGTTALVWPVLKAK